MTFAPPQFHCLYYFDFSVEDFLLGGVFTRPEDAEACKQEFTAAGFKVNAVLVETLEGLKARLLESAIEQAGRLRDARLNVIAGLRQEIEGVNR